MFGRGVITNFEKFKFNLERGVYLLEVMLEEILVALHSLESKYKASSELYFNSPDTSDALIIARISCSFSQVLSILLDDLDAINDFIKEGGL